MSTDAAIDMHNTQTIECFYNLGTGSDNTGSKFESMAYPIDEKIFINVRCYEGEPCVELKRYVVEDDGFISLDSKVGCRLSRTGYDQLVACSGDMLATLEDYSKIEVKTFFIQDDVMAEVFSSVLLSTDCPPVYDFEANPLRMIQLTQWQFDKLVEPKTVIAINKALDILDFE